MSLSMVAATPTDIASASLALVGRALLVKPGENLVVVCDAESAVVGQAIARAGEAKGARVTVSRLDQMRSIASNHSGERPHRVLPDALRRAMRVAQSSVFVASAPPLELMMREELFHLVQGNSIRHAYMPNVTSRSFVQSMALDYDRVCLWGRRMQARLDVARRLSVSSPAGTNLELSFNAPSSWVSQLGEIVPGKCVALPAGVLYGVPASIDGVFVANASVGEFFGARHGLLASTPIRFTIEGGRVVSAEAPAAEELERDVRSMLEFAPNSDRIGVVAVGVNMGIVSPTGNSAIDEKTPGLHLIVGSPTGRHPGASVPWSARTSFSACQASARVAVDGEVLIESGKVVSVL
jgi:aminopeptidase